MNQMNMEEVGLSEMQMTSASTSNEQHLQNYNGFSDINKIQGQLDQVQQHMGAKSYEQQSHKLDNSIDAIMSMDYDNCTSAQPQAHIDIDDVCMQVSSVLQWRSQTQSPAACPPTGPHYNFPDWLIEQGLFSENDSASPSSPWLASDRPSN